MKLSENIINSYSNNGNAHHQRFPPSGFCQKVLEQENLDLMGYCMFFVSSCDTQPRVLSFPNNARFIKFVSLITF